MTELNPEELINYKGKDEVVHFTDYLFKKNESTKNIFKMKCGFPTLDQKTGGLQTGEVVVVTGHTKNGKTLFAESWIRSAMLNDSKAKALIFSFEVQAEVSLQKFTDLMSQPLYVPMQLTPMDFDWLYRKCLEAKLKYDIKIVMIDHLHFMVDMNTKQNMSLNIGAFMRRIKFDIAIGLNLVVIIIAHQGQPKDGKEASVSGMRDSSFIGQEADTNIVVMRRKNYDNSELADYRERYGDEKADLLKGWQNDPNDPYSANLAFIKVENCRRTGVFDVKKLFRKVGEFLEEV
jgi:replicative DNA helicase